MHSIFLEASLPNITGNLEEPLPMRLTVPPVKFPTASQRSFGISQPDTSMDLSPTGNLISPKQISRRKNPSPGTSEDFSGETGSADALKVKAVAQKLGYMKKAVKSAPKAPRN